MKVYTKIIYDASAYRVGRYVIDEGKSEWFWYEGPAALAKGGADQQEMNTANQQNAMEQQLMNQQLQLQMQQLGLVNSETQPTINQILSGQTPQVLKPLQSSLTASYINQLPQLYNNLAGTLNQNLVARGLTGGQYGAGGGGIGQGLGYMASILGQQQQAGATNTAQIMNQNALGLLQNDMGLQMGIANQYGGNVSGFNQGSVGALNAGVQAANNYTNAQTSLLGPVFGGLAGLGSSAITKWCHCAATCFEGGWNDPRVSFIRLRLAVRALDDWRWTLFVGVYGATGYHLAKVVNRSSWLKKQTRKLFDAFIVREVDEILNSAVQAYEL